MHVPSDEQISRIERTVQNLLAEIDQLPVDVVYLAPTAGEWPVMSTLAHLSELLPYWAHEAEAVAKSPGRQFGRAHDDARRIGAIEQHGHDAITAMVPQIRASLADCVDTLRALPADAGAITGQHAARGAMSVDDMVDTFLVSHAEEHASQIAATLRALQASPRS